MSLKIKLNEDVRGVADLEVELQNLLPGLSDEDAHDYAKELWAASKRGGSTSKGVGPSVKIGAQTWTATNLAIDDGGEGIYHNQENNETYYTWEAAMRVAKSIPGWHLPSALEWNDAALACGAEEITRKDSNNNDYKDVQVLKDKLGVTLVGYWNSGSFYNVGITTSFWTATERSSTNAYRRGFSTGGAWMDSRSYNKTVDAWSVRLVKD